jgi:hypothetical protein
MAVNMLPERAEHESGASTPFFAIAPSGFGAESYVWLNARTGDAMPATYLIDLERKLVVSSAWGVVTDDDVREHNRALRADSLFDPTYRQLVDMSGITEDLVDIKTKREVSENQFFAPGVRRAWVSANDFAFGMARMYAIAAEKEGQTIGVFRARGEAEEWLGL